MTEKRELEALSEKVSAQSSTCKGIYNSVSEMKSNFENMENIGSKSKTSSKKKKKKKKNQECNSEEVEINNSKDLNALLKAFSRSPTNKDNVKIPYIRGVIKNYVDFSHNLTTVQANIFKLQLMINLLNSTTF